MKSQGTGHQERGTEGWQLGTIKGVGKWLASIHLRDGCDPCPTPIGSGFVVGSLAGNRIALSAAHVFEHVVDGFDRGARSSFIQRRKAIERVIAERRIVAILELEEGRLSQCPVVAFASYPNWDVVALFVGRPDGGWPEGGGAVQVDVGLPPVHASVAVVSNAAMTLSQPFTLKRKQRGQFLSRRQEIRIGKVLEVKLHGSTLVRGPCMITNIPVTAGMSGGPVLFYDQEQKQKLTVCGIVSSDFSSSGAHEDCSLPGHSTSVLVSAALPLVFDVHSVDGTVRQNVQDLIGAGHIFERGENSRDWKVSYPSTDHVRMRWKC